jgi:hypothetical protein
MRSRTAWAAIPSAKARKSGAKVAARPGSASAMGEASAATPTTPSTDHSPPRAAACDEEGADRVGRDLVRQAPERAVDDLRIGVAREGARDAVLDGEERQGAREPRDGLARPGGRAARQRQGQRDE